MEHITLANAWTVIAGVAAAVVLLVNAAEKIVSVVHAARAPDAAQNARLAALEADMQQVKQYLSTDKTQIDRLTEGDQVSKRSLLALLDHGLDGNNIKQMRDAKEELENYLIKK